MSERNVGAEAIAAKLRQLVARLPEEAANALFEEAQIEMTEAKQRTPVDTGALRASGRVHPPKIVGHDISVALTFGGPAVDYAIVVHEDLDAVHPVGQAKFLELTLNESRPHLLQRVARRIDLDRLVR